MTRALLAALPLALGWASPAFAAEDKSCQPADIAALAGWNGVWLAEGMVSGLNGRAVPGQEDFGKYFVFSGRSAPWNEEGQKRYAKMFASLEGREQQGWGFPVMMSAPMPFEIIVGLAKTAIVGEYRDIRVIYTDGRAHDEDAWATVYGESLGCWHGDTLEIRTTGVHYDPDYNAFAPPLSDEAVFVERLRETAPGRIELDVTITDPVTLSAPWKVHANYFRHEALDRLIIEGALLENDRIVTVNGQQSIAGAEGGLAEDVPPPGDN